MKSTPAISFLLSALILVTASRVAAQTRPDSSDTPGAGHSLSEAQVRAIRLVRSESEKKAVPLAVKLASTAKQIYENLLGESEDEGVRRKLSKQMDEVVAQLLAIKGESIRDMVAVLTPDQKQFVRSEMAKSGAPGDLSELILKVFRVPEK
jgi:Spy/CpxP family protein refolding chaperone